MSAFDNIVEAAKVHPMAVHAYPSGKNQFTVHAVGPKVKHVSVGDKVSSSDLDDLSDAGHKVKEVKKPVSEGWMHIGPAGGSSPYTAFGDKKAGTITLGNDKKFTKKDKEAAGPKPAKVINDRLTTKEEVEQVDESGLSTKTLANYSVKASAATTDKSLPAKKTGNRYAGVHKVDTILSLRDKKKVD